jgi:hypothetical protein
VENELASGCSPRGGEAVSAESVLQVITGPVRDSSMPDYLQHPLQYWQKLRLKVLSRGIVLRTNVQRFLEQIAVWKCDIGEEAEVSGDLWVASGARQQTKDSIPCHHVSGWELSQPCRILVNKAICYASIIKIYVVHVKARCWNNVKTILALIDWRKSREKRRVNILELVMWPWSLGRLDAQNAHNLCRFAQPA